MNTNIRFKYKKMYIMYNNLLSEHVSITRYFCILSYFIKDFTLLIKFKDYHGQGYFKSYIDNLPK